MIDKNFTIETLQKLVRINSVNPALEEGGKGEFETGVYIHDQLRSMGIDSEVNEIAPGRVNVIGIIEAEGTGGSLMLNAHMDTVGVKGMSDPYSGRVSDGKLFGRGAYDMKGSIAAILGAAKAIRDKKIKLKGDLVFAFVADEEYESIGTKMLVQKIKTDSAIVAEPTGLKICTAHRGFGIWKITTMGKTAHGGNHHLGLDANMHMGLLLSELYKMANKLPKSRKHPLCGEASLHVPLISGGRSLFIYSNECTIQLERRTLPGETEDMVRAEIQEIIDNLQMKHSGFRAGMERVIWRSPFEIDQSRSIVKDVSKAVLKITGNKPKMIGHTWWEDSAILGEAGIETVILGPKGGGIHEEVEWVDLDSVIQLAEIFCKMAAR